MNAHSLSWNPDCLRWQNVGPLENLIVWYELIVNNHTDYSIRPQSQGILIIDLALTTTSFEPLTFWEILEEYLSVLDHKVILL